VEATAAFTDALRGWVEGKNVAFERRYELPMLTGFDQHVARSEQLGVWLLVLGFLMIGASGLLNASLLLAGF
jgi:hypothetical protein